MNALTHCPSCGAVLRVPRNASGHLVRCPGCRAVSRVPAETDLKDETISSWIEMDVNAMLETQQALAAERYRPRRKSRATAKSTASTTSSYASKNTSQNDRLPHLTDNDDLSRSTDQNDATDLAGCLNLDDEDILSAEEQEELFRQYAPPFAKSPRPSDAGDPPDPSCDKPTPSAAEAAQAEMDAVHLESQDNSDPVAQENPATANGGVEQLSPGIAPKLTVLHVAPMGVKFQFPCRLLTHPQFRLSMPVQCVFSGEDNRKNLIARPMLFMDQCLSKTLTLEDITSSHEWHELGDRHPREWTRQMGRLEKMTAPFDQPMPYYVSTRYAHLGLHCETQGHGDNCVCEVLIPDGQTAIQWMMRVNGVCGSDFERLEYEVSLLHGSDWKSLDERCRQRLSVWCKLRPHEQFRVYYNDADFNRSDAGFAGLVLTDKRLLFCKYHTRGKIPLDTDRVTLVASTETGFVQLFGKIDGKTTRMIKLREEDFKDLTTRLEQSGCCLQVVAT